MSFAVCSTDVESVTSQVNAYATCGTDLGDEFIERVGVSRKREYGPTAFGRPQSPKLSRCR